MKKLPWDHRLFYWIVEKVFRHPEGRIFPWYAMALRWALLPFNSLRWHLEALTKICKVRKQIKLIEKTGRKLKHKRQDNSFIHYALAEEKRQNRAMIQSIRAEIAMVKKALELLDDYYFETETRTSPVGFMKWSLTHGESNAKAWINVVKNKEA